MAVSVPAAAAPEPGVCPAGHRVFYLSTTCQPELCLWQPGAREVEPNIFLVTLPGSENPPDIYRDLPSDLQLAAMEFGLRRLRKTHELGATLSIVDYPERR